MYLTYDEYERYGGTLSENEFGRFGFRATREIDNATFDRSKSYSETTAPEELKRCSFELIEYISKNSISGTVSGVRSFSNDGYSVSFADQKTASEAICDIIRTYLIESADNLLYCGV